MGIEVLEIDLNKVNEITKESTNVTCVVSAVAGLRDVIIDLQKRILDAALQAQSSPWLHPVIFKCTKKFPVSGFSYRLIYCKEQAGYLSVRILKDVLLPSPAL